MNTKAGSILVGVTILSSLLVHGADAQAQKRIVLIAGQKSHGPEGNGIHDYAWSVRLLETMLEKSNIADRITVTTFVNGWPADTSALEAADTIMIVSDGRDGDKGREAPHLARADRVELIERIIQRGCGLVTFHFSTFAPDALGDRALHWYGGYFDWETDGQRKWYSDIATMEAEVKPADDGHPILRGIQPFTMREEFYFDIRFPPSGRRWTPIWKVDQLPAKQPHGQVVSWAIERPDGGRGFGTTCGHFYDNWQLPAFRKTVLNALAWTAHVPVPEEGVESSYFTHSDIAAHLAQPDLVSSAEPPGGDPYAEEPYWYKPGHPTAPAEATLVKTLPGFQAERIMTVPEEFGSWTALCVDPKGRLITAAQHHPGLYRVTPPAIGDDTSESVVERLSGAASQVGWSHGLLHAFGSLYVTVTESSEEAPTGVYRLHDSNGDDQYDESRLLMKLDGRGEHGPHNIVIGPDRESLYIICGNGTPLPSNALRRRPVPTDGIDHLVPSGFGDSRHTVAGWVARFRPDGSELELFSSGLRNSFDLAFNQVGDLFTFDSDMEWDLGAPWYRPTRICHVVSGGEFGWRDDAAKWPDYYEDSVAPVVDVGPGSPTGILFGYGAKFPAKYQRALFACDWTFATIHAVHLTPRGGSYRAEVEEFVGGRGLPVTDAVIGADGAMYFTVGGRRLGSALYRVHYVGDEPTAALGDQLPIPPFHSIRRRLEASHGAAGGDSIQEVWPYLGHRDRAVRFAARVALETSDVNSWRERAIAESEIDKQLTALLALARQGSVADCRSVLETMNKVALAELTEAQLLRALRAYEVALARGELRAEAGRADDGVQQLNEAVRAKLRQLFPRPAGEDKAATGVARGELIALAAGNRELSRLLCYLDDGASIERNLQLMEADAGQRPTLGSGYFVRNPKYGEAVQDMLQAAPLVDRMHYAQMLLFVKQGWTKSQRRRYFSLVSSATQESRGGYWYEEFWQRIREAGMDQLPTDLREELADVAVKVDVSSDGNLPRPQGPGRKWSLNELLELIEQGVRDRDFENGRRTFAAAQCITCHRFNGEGSAVGPDLSTIAQRFTLRDLLDSTVHPSKAVSDQYRVTMLTMVDGTTVSGRVASRDAVRLRIATNLMRPGQLTTIELAEVDDELPVPVSTMPTQLLDPLNADEILDLLGYLISGGRQDHLVFAK